MNSGRKKRMITHHAYWYLIVLAMILWLSGCQTGAPALSAAAHNSGTVQPTVEKSVAETAEAESKEAKYVLTPYPTRPLYSPGELVNYTAQTGDTLLALAARFNTSVKEILEANSFIPPTATTMPPGMPMKIPIYYLPLWGSPYKILPDSLFVDGPAQRNFDTQAFVSRYPGWLNGYTEYAAQAHRSGAEIVDFVALRYSVSPRLLLALLEYQSGALSNPELSESLRTYPMGYEDGYHKGLYLQLNWAANLLNNGYYRYRAGILLSIEHPDGTVERIDPWQNAATVSLQNYFNQLYSDHKAYAYAISSLGLAHIYQSLFGDPWQNVSPHIPGSLSQPDFKLPFEAGSTWAFTGGPHSPYGRGYPFAALDFAPGDITAGSCQPSNEAATALADGVVVRSETGVIVLDLDGDGDERTGWDIFYLHLDDRNRPRVGDHVMQGELVGYPSCKGGRSTGSHVHIARKYNGEWILADGPLAFNLEGWVAHNGAEHYLGTLTRGGEVVTACVCTNAKSFITAGE